MISKGSRLDIPYGNKKFTTLVIDPNGLGNKKPTIGIWFREIDRHIGIPQNTLTQWVVTEFDPHLNLEKKSLKTPSGKRFDLIQISDKNGCNYLVMEICNLVDFVMDVLLTPGKLSKETKVKVMGFFATFAAEGLYASAYLMLKGTWNRADSESLLAWRSTRLEGIPVRKDFTSWIASIGSSDFARFTNLTYRSLFGMTAKVIRGKLARVDGVNSNARNHLEKEYLRVVKLAEDLAPKLYLGENDTIDRCIKEACKIVGVQHKEIVDAIKSL